MHIEMYQLLWDKHIFIHGLFVLVNTVSVWIFSELGSYFYVSKKPDVLGQFLVEIWSQFTRFKLVQNYLSEKFFLCDII